MLILERRCLGIETTSTAGASVNVHNRREALGIRVVGGGHCPTDGKPHRVDVPEVVPLPSGFTGATSLNTLSAVHLSWHTFLVLYVFRDALFYPACNGLRSL